MVTLTSIPSQPQCLEETQLSILVYAKIFSFQQSVYTAAIAHRLKYFVEQRMISHPRNSRTTIMHILRTRSKI